MKPVKAILQATEYVSVRRVPRPGEYDDAITQRTEIGTMGRLPESEMLEPDSINIPNHQPAQPTKPRNQRRQPRSFWQGVWRGLKVTAVLAFIATTTLFGGACWMMWRDSIRKEQIFRNDPFFNNQPLPTPSQEKLARDAHAFWNYQLDDQRPQSHGGER